MFVSDGEPPRNRRLLAPHLSQIPQELETCLCCSVGREGEILRDSGGVDVTYGGRVVGRAPARPSRPTKQVDHDDDDMRELAQWAS